MKPSKLFPLAILVAYILSMSTSTVADDDNEFEFFSPQFWQTLDGKPVSESWEFVDNEIRLIKPRGGNGSIVSPELPPNFDLTFEWKIEQRTNTGLKYRVRRFGKSLFGNRYLGVEYQIMDDPADSDSKGSTASIYDLIAPQHEKELREVGQWNVARIVANGNQLEHYLNGKLVAEALTSGPSWEKTIALSKFFGSVDFGRPKTGDRIMLTDHGGKAAYRNFAFKPLASKSPESTSSAEPQPKRSGPFLGNGMRNSWADQSSIVIWTRTTAQPQMNADGLRFISLSTKEARTLANETDPDAIHAAQIPAGKTINDMFGACPGAEGRVRLIYFPEKQRKAMVSTDWVSTRAESDFSAQWKLEGLKPGTTYAAVVEAAGLESDATTAVLRGSFKTAPRMNAKEPMSFCFTTCHDFIRRDDGMKGHKIYPSMNQIAPDFVVHAGDIEYYDKPDPWAMTIDLMRFKWARIFSLPSNRDFYSRTTSYFLKDDHDTLKNDCWAGQTYGSVSFEEGVKLFNEEQFPTRSPRYMTVQWGRDLQVWFLEGRDYRSSNTMPDGPMKTILGAEQKAWLFETLSSSKAKFKLICSPTPIVGPDRKNKRDNHANEVFAYEGDEIRNELAKLENVIVLCGDRHWQYASYDQDADLWEFGCGPGSEKHQLGWKAGDERPLHRFLRVKGGFLSGELKYRGKEKEATLTLRHHKVTGEAVSEFQFPIEEPEGEEAASSDGESDQTAPGEETAVDPGSDSKRN